MLELTDAAREKFIEFLEQEEKNNAYIRIYLSGVG